MENEPLFRLTIFLGAFALLAVCENLRPRRIAHVNRARRWATNWLISLSNTAILWLCALIMPALAIGAAWDAERMQWGLLNILSLPDWLGFVIAILLLDFAIWAQHWATHKIPILWRLHRVHHADRDMDVTTAIRFHPIEIALSMGLKIILVYALGPSALTVLIFEIFLNLCAMFNHANIALPLWLDRVLRMVIVTPDMHRVHHSVNRHEHDSNYGFALSIWDQLFRTYRAAPQMGHAKMQIGLQWQDSRPSRFLWSLRLPFMRK